MQAHRFLTFIFTSIETILVGGTCYGLSYMQNVFIQEGFFYHGGNSTLQIERLNLVSTISTTAGSLTCPLFGFLIDAKGLWFARTATLAAIATGYVLFSLSKTLNNFIIFPAAVLLNSSNLGLWAANCQISRLFPGHESFYRYFINGCGMASYCVFYLFNRLYFQFGLSFEIVFYSAALFTVLSHVHTFVLFPSKSVNKTVSKKFEYGYKELQCFKSNISNEELDSGNKGSNDFNEERKTIDCLKSKEYRLFFARHAYQKFSVSFFFWGNLQNWIDSVSKGDKDLNDSLATFYSILIFCSVIVSPAIGLSCDKIKLKFGTESGLEAAKIKYNSLTFFLTDLLLLMFYVSACIPFKPFLYLTLLISLFHLCLFFGNAVCFLSRMFPLANFGKLFTFTTCASSVSSLLVFPATVVTVRWVGFFNMCLLFVGTTFVLLLFSVRGLFAAFKTTRECCVDTSCRVNPAYKRESEL